MIGVTGEVWALARYLYAVESFGKERGHGTGFFGVAGGRATRNRGAFSGFDGSQGTSRHARSEKQAIGKSRGGWNMKINVQVGWGRLLLETVGPLEGNCKLLMDRAYEDEQTWLAAQGLGYTLAVPPRSNRRKTWEYDRELYKRRNAVERFFRRLKAFRCVGTKYKKLDVMFTAFILIAIICISLHCVHTP
jgi:transposase